MIVEDGDPFEDRRFDRPWGSFRPSVVDRDDHRSGPIGKDAGPDFQLDRLFLVTDPLVGPDLAQGDQGLAGDQAGANLGQPIGIVMLNEDAVPRAPSPELEADLERHLTAVNAALDPHERLQCLVAMSAPWTVENDIVTPTFKVKRNRIDELYGSRYEQWEATGRRVIWA